MKILIFGKGFIGKRCAQIWGDECVLSDHRISDITTAAQEIAKHKPDAVLNAAGRTGRPNVDWCDDHPRETMLGNTLTPIVLAEACQKQNVYLLHLGSGCIFYGKSSHPDGAWRENDFANPMPAYTRSKWAADLVLSTLPNVGIARLRLPIDSVPSERNLIDKVTKYPKVIDVVNSVTIVEDLVDTCHQLMQKKAEGVFHCTNPGTMSHRELIALYQKLVDPSHTCQWITEEDLVAQGLATKKRSNNIMSSSRLEKLGIKMRPVKEALPDTMKKYAANLKKVKVNRS